MRVSGSQFCTQKVPFAREAKQRMVTDLFKVAVKGCPLLLSVDGVFSGINFKKRGPLSFLPGGADRSETVQYSSVFNCVPQYESLAQNLIEGHSCGGCGIERIQGAGGRNLDQQVTLASYQWTYSFLLVSNH
jgi:hypothetical protein